MGINLLGIRLSDISTSDVLKDIQLYLETGGFHHIVTVNPEFIVDAQSNKEFFRVLNAADLSLIDGIGVLVGLCFLSRYSKEKRQSSARWLNYFRFFKCYLQITKQKGQVVINGQPLHRTTGVDLIWLIIQQDWMKFRKVYLLGGTNNVAARAAKRLHSVHPDVQFRFSNGHKNIREILMLKKNGLIDKVKDEERMILEDINAFAPDVLLVAYGHPWQDLWINQVKGVLKTKVAIGIGGAFDYISQTVPRAPVWMRSLGLEWLYRLMTNRQRFWRIVKATFTYARFVIDSV